MGVHLYCETPDSTVNIMVSSPPTFNENSRCTVAK